MNLSENIKRIRKENNLSQEQLAEKLGVSRQAVSKWESNQAYPEMDKVLQLSKMFNLNIDDLLNQNIKEVTNEKQSKLAINKYIDDFLSFITKTIDMFSSMKFKNKIKCIFEQLVIAGVLAIIFLIIAAIGENVLYGLLSMLPYNVIHVIKSIFSSIYLVFALVLGIVLLIYIFKVRYLDYYIIVKDDKETNEKPVEKEEKIEDKNKENKKILLEKKQEKIVIRDPKHSGYKFISGMIKCLLFFIKLIAILIALAFSISLICFVLSLVVSFLIEKTGIFFIGLVLSLLSCISVNIIILIILFNFIIGKKNNKRNLLITFIVSLIIFGLGLGLSIIGFTNFNYIDDINNIEYIEDEIIIKMQDDLILHNYYGYYEYIEENREDIKIVYKHTDMYELSIDKQDNNIHLYPNNSDNNFMLLVRQGIEDINNKKIINYSNIEMKIYASKENIEKLKLNLNIEEENNNYYDNLEQKNYEYQEKISELEDKIYDKDLEIENLKEELKEYN